MAEYSYWKECVEITFDEIDLKATDKQMEDMAGSIEVWLENQSMAKGYDCIPNQANIDHERAIKILNDEKSSLESTIDIYRNSVASRYNVPSSQVYLDGKNVMIDPS